MISEIILWVALALCGVAMLIYYGKSDAPVRSAIKGMFTGAAALAVVHFAGEYFSICLPLNIFNIAAALILGIPGVILLIIGKFLV